MKRLAVVWTLALLASACSGSLDEGASVSSPPPVSASEEPSDGTIHRTYDVGGHELFMDCTGTGTPTVVMLHGIIWESGFGGDSVAWDATREALPARTCAYDRRNVGLSEQVPGMSTATDAVEDLHGVLEAAGVEPPYVLAGHSFGGLLSLLYAGTYPDEVAGIVLVDATLPLEWDLDPPEVVDEVKASLNENDERIDFYGAGALTASVLERLPDVPISYLYALRQQDDPNWEEGAYEAGLRKFMRSLPLGRLVEFDTDHDMLTNIPADVADQIRKVLAQTAA
jgi:pimeloyl-ACP methyl ester carboxylesterase